MNRCVLAGVVLLLSVAEVRAQYNPPVPGQLDPYRPVDPAQMYGPWPQWARPLPYRYPYPYPYGIYVPFPIGQNSYAPAAPQGQPQQESAPTDNRARISIRLPSNAGDVWVGDQKMADRLATERLFISPALEPGHTYTYTIRVRYVRRGAMVSDERTIRVRPNEATAVDFTAPAAKVSTP